jgi:hypothetical protein
MKVESIYLLEFIKYCDKYPFCLMRKSDRIKIRKHLGLTTIEIDRVIDRALKAGFVQILHKKMPYPVEITNRGIQFLAKETKND